MSKMFFHKRIAGVLAMSVFFISPAAADAYDDGVQIGHKLTVYQAQYAFEQMTIARLPYYQYRLPEIVRKYRRNERRLKRRHRSRPHERKLRRLRDEPVVYEYLTR